MLYRDKGNATKLDFLFQFSQWIKTVRRAELVVELAEDAYPWIESQVQDVLKKLNKPEIPECRTLLTAAYSCGGIVYLRDV